MQDIFRAFLILVVSCVIGLVVNACRVTPLSILDPRGPGALLEGPLISIEGLKALIQQNKNFALLDVREDETYNHGHAPQSIHIAEAHFDERYHELGLAAVFTAASETVVLCDSSECPSAERVAEKLRKYGHANVRVLNDGWRAYQHAGLPVETGDGGAGGPAHP